MLKNLIMTLTLPLLLFSCSGKQEIVQNIPSPQPSPLEERENPVETSLQEEIKPAETIKIDSPVYTLTGEVLSGTTKIEITWKNSDKTDSYELKKFKVGDKEFLSNLRLDYGNIAKGTNEYQVNFIKADGSKDVRKYVIDAEYDEVDIDGKIFYGSKKTIYGNGNKIFVNDKEYELMLIKASGEEKYIYYSENNNFKKLEAKMVFFLDKGYYVSDCKRDEIKGHTITEPYLCSIYTFDGKKVYDNIGVIGVEGEFRINKIVGDYVFLNLTMPGIGIGCPTEPFAYDEVYYKGNTYSIYYFDQEKKGNYLLFKDGKIYFIDKNEKDIINNLKYITDNNLIWLWGDYNYKIITKDFRTINSENGELSEEISGYNKNISIGNECSLNLIDDQYIINSDNSVTKYEMKTPLINTEEGINSKCIEYSISKDNQIYAFEEKSTRYCHIFWGLGPEIYDLVYYSLANSYDLVPDENELVLKNILGKGLGNETYLEQKNIVDKYKVLENKYEIPLKNIIIKYEIKEVNGKIVLEQSIEDMNK